jgi:hypothetical protein
MNANYENVIEFAETAVVGATITVTCPIIKTNHIAVRVYKKTATDTWTMNGDRPLSDSEVAEFVSDFFEQYGATVEIG